MLVTGATGFVGSHVVQRAIEAGYSPRALVRESSNRALLDEWGVEQVVGDFFDHDALKKAVDGVSAIVHCAAKVGDWGPIDDYRAVNVRGLEHLLVEAEAAGSLERFIQVSSLGVYEGRDHHGTDESEPATLTGMDGYTLTKAEAERLVLEHVRDNSLPATVVRPGFIYGPRDQTVLPRLLERLKIGQVKFFGSGDQLLNNTYVGNLVDAIFLCLEKPETIGEVFNITDGQLVSKKHYISSVAELAGYPVPTGSVPLGVARFLTKASERVYRLLGKKEAPLLSNARFKFLGLNLDFSIEKARRQLGYDPQVTFDEGVRRMMEWYKTNSDAA
ncbi:3 beta-hydroxysteroid dehydrogenase/Delta 5--_4-isomerase [Symmachiella dynata]|uniref:3 beta-hydroxysteroid dehydrogenase/Delta 5-->4-isomerase n=1 Tax=Symmachiella dynata TaxID=2527995 RepID=A0A517ZJN8_9PLAN|nr:NAD-dependent epimerase/dehydratase family protein [Symmachiella dynata]QDU42705.1 3 beta-hydroxysteroid dehydrogenase/Delta 5-->4-isomerase [Symmachiella dynata]